MFFIMWRPKHPYSVAMCVVPEWDVREAEGQGWTKADCKPLTSDEAEDFCINASISDSVIRFINEELFDDETE